MKKDGKTGTAGKGPLIQCDMSATLGTSQDQYLFVMTTEKNSVIGRGQSPALRSRDYKDPPVVIYYEARRLTPTECARLQGFPNDWAEDVPHSDSAEYKMWGNGIALPCLLPMMKAMADILREGDEHEQGDHEGTDERV